MDYYSNRVDQIDLKPGDHIYSWRTSGIFAHHGIFVGNMEDMYNAVVHFNNGPVGSSTFSCSSISSRTTSTHSRCSRHPIEGHGVVSSCVDCFLSGGTLYRFEYNAGFFRFATMRSGTCSPAAADPNETVVCRAKYRLDIGYGFYNAITNNCLDFSLYCKTGGIRAFKERPK